VLIIWKEDNAEMEEGSNGKGKIGKLRKLK
jgi:hypothetical protein